MNSFTPRKEVVLIPHQDFQICPHCDHDDPGFINPPGQNRQVCLICGGTNLAIYTSGRKKLIESLKSKEKS